MMWGGGMMGLGWGFGILGLVLTVLLWGGLILAGVWLVRALFPQAGPPALSRVTDGGAREILDRRYAQGEISREDYETMKETLSREGAVR